ncbi:hypothetical protein KBD33_03100 [Candidatus Gracilibacteria bacterium]|nr:hypothetical protein [Candidatus Gracilibacteria bacterium]
MSIRYTICVGIAIGSLIFSQSGYSLDATYYSDAFEGSNTANGSLFSQKTHSSAMCDIQLGSYVYVQSGQTGAVVTVNDRPNCSSNHDVIDLSSSVFELFAPLTRGRIPDVQTTLIGNNPTSISKKTFDTTSFFKFSILLSKKLSNTYLAGDSIIIEGKVVDKKEYVMVYLQSEKDKQEYSTLVRVEKNGKFKFPFTLPKIPGTYYFVIASGNSFQTTEPEVLHLVDPVTLKYPDIPSESYTYKPELQNNSTPYIAMPEGVWGATVFSQGKTVYKTSGQALTTKDIPFKGGSIQVLIEGYKLSTPSSLDRSRNLGVIWSGSVLIDRTRDIIGKNNVIIFSKPSSKNFSFKVPLGEKITKDYYITYPSGDIRKFTFGSELLDESGLFLKQGAVVKGSFSTRESGVYRFETVLESGFAFFNVPVSQGIVWSIYDPYSKGERTLLRAKLATVRESGLKRINSLRVALSRDSIVLDDTLNTLAQAKANYMAENDYVQHKTKDGQDIRGLSNELNLKITGTLYENIAGGINVSDIVLQDGLEESGSHRFTMLVPTVKKMGIGYVLKKNKTYLVQVFSD